jgi:predicted nucleic acid-binding protein
MSADFIDSNVILYLFDDTDARKRKIAESVVRDALETGSGLVSFQVIQETLNVVLQKLRRPASVEDARRFFEAVLSPLWKAMPSMELYRRALELRSRYQFSFYDSLIIAAALEMHCTQLLSEDLQHGQRIDGLKIVNPFAP